jgi:hypothetical protein
MDSTVYRICLSIHRDKIIIYLDTSLHKKAQRNIMSSYYYVVYFLSFLSKMTKSIAFVLRRYIQIIIFYWSWETIARGLIWFSVAWWLRWLSFNQEIVSSSPALVTNVCPYMTLLLVSAIKWTQSCYYLIYNEAYNYNESEIYFERLWNFNPFFK